MAREAKSPGMFIAPNVRFGFITDRGKHRALRKRMSAVSENAKRSDEDLDWFGEKGSHDEIASRWLELGPKLIVITKGAHGADAYTANATVRVPGVKVDVVDTVGAGDTVNAGILASLNDQGLLSKQAIAKLDEDQIHAAVALGVRAAAVTVSRAGANPPWAAEMRD